MQLSASDHLYPYFFANYPPIIPSNLIISGFFQQPSILIDDVMLFQRKRGSNSDTLDWNMMKQIYLKIQKEGIGQKVKDTYTKALEKFEEKGQLKKFVVGDQQITYFMAILFWDKIFLLETHKLALFRALNLLHAADFFAPCILKHLQGVPAEYLLLMITRLHNYLLAEFQKLMPGAVDPKFHKIIQISIENMCKFLEWIYVSSQKMKKLPPETFVLKGLGEFFNPAQQFKIALLKGDMLNFMKYPFLLDFDYKFNLLQIQSMFQQKMNISKNLQSGFQGLLLDPQQSGILNADGGLNIQGLIFFYLQVHRNNLLDESMQKLYKVKGNLKSPMKISFIGQQGNDAGGVKNEYFHLITKEIFNPFLDMFIPKNNGRFHWFNGYSFEPPIRFQFVGMLLGLAIYNTVYLDIKFPELIYKKLLQKNKEELSIEIIEDLQQIQPQVYKTLKFILNQKGSLDSLQLYFNIEFDQFGEKIVEQLTQSGNKIKLDQSNKQEYCLFYADYIINKHISKHFNAFKRGFLRVVSGYVIDIFQPFELKRIICGNENIDFKELQTSSKYEGYTENDPLIMDLWDILTHLSLEDKKAFLKFVTGTDRVPIEGLKSLKFTVQKHGSSEQLPTAQTCFNVFLLPNYTNRKQLERGIELILKNNEGFGLI